MDVFRVFVWEDSFFFSFSIVTRVGKEKLYFNLIFFMETWLCGGLLNYSSLTGSPRVWLPKLPHLPCGLMQWGSRKGFVVINPSRGPQGNSSKTFFFFFDQEWSIFFFFSDGRLQNFYSLPFYLMGFSHNWGFLFCTLSTNPRN